MTNNTIMILKLVGGSRFTLFLGIVGVVLIGSAIVKGANACGTALSSASPIKPPPASCPSGLQSTFAGEQP